MTATRATIPTVVTPADEQLMMQIKSGDADAFEELYERYSVRAYRVARSVCRDDDRAQEAVQEAFIGLWRNPGTYRPDDGTVAAWLLAVVRHRAIDVARRAARHARHRADPRHTAEEDAVQSDAVASEVSDQAVARQRANHLRALLEQLPDAQREVIVLAYYGELSHTEIASHLDLPPGTVKGRMRQGLKRLRIGIGPTNP